MNLNLPSRLLVVVCSCPLNTSGKCFWPVHFSHVCCIALFIFRIDESHYSLTIVNGNTFYFIGYICKIFGPFVGNEDNFETTAEKINKTLSESIYAVCSVTCSHIPHPSGSKAKDLLGYVNQQGQKDVGKVEEFIAPGLSDFAMGTPQIGIAGILSHFVVHDVIEISQCEFIDLMIGCHVDDLGLLNRSCANITCEYKSAIDEEIAWNSKQDSRSVPVQASCGPFHMSYNIAQMTTGC